MNGLRDLRGCRASGGVTGDMMGAGIEIAQCGLPVVVVAGARA